MRIRSGRSTPVQPFRGRKRCAVNGMIGIVIVEITGRVERRGVKGMQLALLRFRMILGFESGVWEIRRGKAVCSLQIGTHLLPAGKMSPSLMFYKAVRQVQYKTQLF